MTSREIVMANLNHDGPPRPGFKFERDRLDDFCLAGAGPSKTFQPRRWEEGPFEYYEDEWKNLWKRMKDGCMKGEIHKPALEDWAQLDGMHVPDLDNPERYAGMRERFAAHPDQFKAGFVNWVFNAARYLRRMDIYFMDLIQYRDEIERLHDTIADVLEGSIHCVADAGADAIFFGEDLGVQDRLLMSPAMWRDIFQRHYVRLTNAAHERGLKVIMHSCGYNWELIDDLCQAGIDCFQFDQPAVYDMPALAGKLRHYGAALFSPVDIQKVLPTGDRAFIEAEAERMVNTFRGFLICSVYPDLHGIGVEREWDDWAYEAVLRASGIDPADHPYEKPYAT
ncbi:MAG: uroporphyrinogen decarboxylase family protein [Planctomycetota bacterium]